MRAYNKSISFSLRNFVSFEEQMFSNKYSSLQSKYCEANGGFIRWEKCRVKATVDFIEQFFLQLTTIMQNSFKNTK